MRELDLVNKEDNNFMLHFMVEYLDEHKFNCYLRNERGFLTPILLDAEINMHPEVPDSVLVRTDSEQYKVDYYIDKDETVTLMDYEHVPISYVSEIRFFTITLLGRQKV